MPDAQSLVNTYTAEMVWMNDRLREAGSARRVDWVHPVNEPLPDADLDNGKEPWPAVTDAVKKRSAEAKQRIEWELLYGLKPKSDADEQEERPSVETEPTARPAFHVWWTQPNALGMNRETVWANDADAAARLVAYVCGDPEYHLHIEGVMVVDSFETL